MYCTQVAIFSRTYVAKLDSPATVSKFIQSRRPHADAHHIGDDQQNGARHAALGWKSHLQ